MQAPHWIEPVSERMKQLGDTGTLLVSFPVYRPDLAKELAFHLDLEFYDFRSEYMAARGIAADKIPLNEMEGQIGSNSAGGLVFHNVEALLASCPEDERCAWLLDIARRDFGGQVVIPLYLFASQLDYTKLDGNLLELEPETLPEQGLINRLLNA